MAVHLDQRRLYIEATLIGHGQIQQQTARHGWIVMREKLRGGSKGTRDISSRA
jgi:hypothetical protein